MPFLCVGLTAKDIGVFEVHDCFSIAEVLMYEALGLADHGKGTHFAADGHTRTLPPISRCSLLLGVPVVAHPS